MGWELLDNIRGPKGEKGDTGTIAAASVTTLPPGAPATVAMTGPTASRSVVFGIPQGAKGEQGVAGTLSSASAESVPAGEPAAVIMSGTTEVKHAHFKVPRGLPGLNAVGNDEAFSVALGAPDTLTGTVFREHLDEKTDRHNVLTSIRDFGGTGDGVTSDALAASAAAAASEAVLYPKGAYAGAAAFGNAYSASKYTEAIGERLMGGLRGAPISNPLPLLWVQKHSSANRTENPQEWDNGAIYAALIKESGNAYSAALTGYGRHESAESGDLIGVHGRGLATKTSSKVWGMWAYASSIGDAALTAPLGLAGMEVNINHQGADTGWSPTTTTGQQNGLLIGAVDGAKRMTRAVAITKASAPDGYFHTGILVMGSSITPADAATDHAAGIGNNEAFLITGSSGRPNGLRFHTGLHGVGVSFAEASFRSNVAMLMGSHQRIGVGAGSSTPAVVEFVNDDSSNRYLNLTNMLLRVNNVAVVGERRTGWVAATGTASRATFDSTTVTLPNLAARVKSLIDDLMSHGLIGA